MTMESIYQLTFFLALALLAIVITVFVLAVSLLGRAVKMSSKEQEKAAKEQKDTTEKEIVKIEKEITEARKTGQLNIEQLENRLKQMRKQDKKYERALRHIKAKPKFLRARWGALIPGAFFVGSIILSGLAVNLLDSAFIASLCLWGVALITIGTGIYLICQSLIVIEGVAITSEETAFVREAEVFKTALRELEEEKKPKLAFLFVDKQPPFHIGSGEELEVEFDIFLIQGTIAKKPEVAIFAPPSFDFPGRETWLQPEGKKAVGGHITTKLEFEDLRTESTQPAEITIRVPSDTGEFTLKYRLSCEGFDSDYEEFEVVVYPPQQEPS